MSGSKQDKQNQRLAALPNKLTDYHHPAESPSPSKRLPKDKALRQSMIEQMLQDAMTEGKFDNLPGQGKPLILDNNPYLEPGRELGFSILKNNGFAPEWIERDKKIRRDLEQARYKLQLVWQQRRHNPAKERSWQAAVTRFAERLQQINKDIRDFNLIVPVLSAHRPLVELEEEIRWVTGG